MKKPVFLLIAISLLLSACATSSIPQVTVTSEVTVTSTLLPTETPIPTPTLHPQFAALQEQVAASGGRFILHPDGMISDGAEPIPGLTVSPDGTMTLTVDGETMTLDPTKAVFDDENGFSYPGYEQDADGNWLEAAPSAEQVWEQEAKDWGITPESVTVKHDVDGKIMVVDNASNKVIYWDGYWNQDTMINWIPKIDSCKKSGWEGSNIGKAKPLGDADRFKDIFWYPFLENGVTPLLRKEGYPMGSVGFSRIYLGGECWATIPAKDAVTQVGFDQFSYIFWKRANGSVGMKKVFEPKTTKIVIGGE